MVPCRWRLRRNCGCNGAKQVDAGCKAEFVCVRDNGVVGGTVLIAIGERRRRGRILNAEKADAILEVCCVVTYFVVGRQAGTLR